MATHSSILAWKNPMMKEPDRLQSVGLQRVRWIQLSDFTFFECLSCRITQSLDLPSISFLYDNSLHWRDSRSHSLILMNLGKALLRNQSDRKSFHSLSWSNWRCCFSRGPTSSTPFLLSFPPHTLLPCTHHSLRHHLHLLLPLLASSPTITVPAELACSSRFSSLPGLLHKDIRKCSGWLLSEFLLLF